MPAITDVPSIAVVTELLVIGAEPVGFAQLPTSPGHVKTVVHFESGPARFTLDGVTAPTPSLGTPAFDGDERIFDRYEASRFQAVRQGAVNSVATATHYVRA
ncbi:MAG: hypothetical protein EPO00_02730 [Chloroflexota bacterium]|nr:MAG: hypothetical protein EPO00_02730 [Chloroflexota bacterium]